MYVYIVYMYIHMWMLVDWDITSLTWSVCPTGWVLPGNIAVKKQSQFDGKIQLNLSLVR